jgi:predicted DsbA family dithiol-disulfide isomerase
MIRIEIVSDLVCPWCFIGTRRLDMALAEVRQAFPDLVCRKLWRPFFLNPNTPPEGEPYLPFLEQKFGGPAPVQALFERVRAAGRPYGIDYAFEKIQLRANTLQAHRLIHWAQRQGDATALVERLFSAQFQRGEHVGDPVLLARIAGECGYAATDAAAYLASTADVDVIRDEEHKFRMMGISMVPTFIVEGEQIVVGAEDPSVLAAVIRRFLG